MIERLLAADAALERDELDVAERLFAQVADADPRNAIALVGLARLAIRAGDPETATERLRRALEIDPEEAAARRLLAELAPRPAEAAAPAAVDVPAAVEVPPEPPAAAAEATPEMTPPPRRSLLQRLLRLLGIRRG